MLNVLAFLIVLFSFVHIQMGGEFYISELALGFVLLLIGNKGKRLSEPLPKVILYLGLLWLGSQIFTDLVRSSPVENLLRGWAAIIFFLVDFAAIYLIVGKDVKRARIVVLAYALGGILQFVVAPTEFGTFEPWKWALAMPVTLLFLLYIEVKQFSAGLMFATLILLGLIDVYLNARSMGGITIITGFVIYLSWQPGFHAMFKRRLNAGKRILLAALGVGTVGLLLAAYQGAAESGYLPEDVMHKYEMTKSSDLGLVGLILGGRIEFVASTQAVMDSPIIGHGSWAEDRKYALLLLEVNKILGTDRDEAELEAGVDYRDLIPAHSHILQAWVWAGLLGAIFWFAVLFFLFKALVSVIRYPNALQPISVFFCITAIWDIFFSPFGSIMRLMWAIKLAVIWVAKEAAESAALTGR